MLPLLLMTQAVGPDWTPTGQRLEPAGSLVEIGARPLDLAISPEGRTLAVKTHAGVLWLDPATLAKRAEWTSKTGASMTGLAWTSEGDVLFTDARSGLHRLREGVLLKTYDLPAPKVGGSAYGCGVAVSGGFAYVAGSRSNELIRLDLVSGETKRLALPPAPYGVATDGGSLWVSCWGRSPVKRSAKSSGTDVDVDERGVGTGGTLVRVSLADWRVDRTYPVGGQPTEIVASGGRATVACANDDALWTADANRARRFEVRVPGERGFGTGPNGLAVAGNRLAVTLGGSNALAVLDRASLKPVGFVPTGWFPGPVAAIGGRWVVGNVKGFSQGRDVGVFHGTLQNAPLVPTTETTDKARRLAAERKSGTADPRIQHVVYILKENRTYDQVFGDVKEGDGDPALCMYGEDVTPNHHALARRYGLLDNFYCNGVLSADGHAWAMEGNASASFERSFGGWTRSYPFGDDPLTVAKTGFLWDLPLARGRSFRNHGEYDYGTAKPARSHDDLLRDSAAGRFPTFAKNIGVERLRAYSSDVPGWNMAIPDQTRADLFLRELKAAKTWPDLTILYLPQDHTSGTAPGGPSPRAQVADNDLALGRVVEGLSRSKFWPKMAIFVCEDDPQDGFDHVDGHRTVGLVISPWTRGNGTVKGFYNQTSMTRTMLGLLGVAPRTTHETRSPSMLPLFRKKADPAPYTALSARVDLFEKNPPLKTLTGQRRLDALASARLDLRRPDGIEDDELNRILWRAAKPGRPYPAKFAGAHGRGLARRGVRLDPQGR